MRSASYRHMGAQRGRKTLLVPLLKLLAVLSVIMYVLTFIAIMYWRRAGQAGGGSEIAQHTAMETAPSIHFARVSDADLRTAERKRREDLQRLHREAISNLVKRENKTVGNNSGNEVLNVLTRGVNRLNSFVAPSLRTKPARKYSARLPIFQGSYLLTNPPELIQTYQARTERIRQALMNKFASQIQFQSQVLDSRQAIGCFFLRSAVHVRRGVFVISRIIIPHCNLLEETDTVSSICDADVPVTSCNCTTNDIRVICNVDPIESRDLDTIKNIYLNGQQVQVPVEHIVAQSPHQRESMHVCLQGIVYPDVLRGGQTYVPLGLLNAFLNHYSRYGEITDFHIYTNASETIDGIVSEAFRPKLVLEHARLWFHDTLFPPRSDGAKDFIGREKKAQLFVQSDCYLRAIAMGAKYVLMVDQDELLYPSNAIDRDITGQIPIVSRLEQVQPTPLAVFFKSYIFHTLYCESNNDMIKSVAPKEGDVEGNLKRMTVSRLDKKTFQGRRKGLFIVPNNVTFAIHHVFPLVHGVELVAFPRRLISSDIQISESFHLHHFREPYHDLVCSKNPQKDPLPEVPISELKWTLAHANCEDLFSPSAKGA